MREIKFRVWTGKEYRYPPMLWECDYEDFDIAQDYAKDIKAIEQCTGLQDSTGRDVYEGDVVKTREGKSLVKHWKGNTWLEGDDDLILLSDREAEVEVIGNIHEKPLDNGVPVA